MEQSTRFIGTDVHKETIVVAVTASGDVGKGHTVWYIAQHRRGA